MDPEQDVFVPDDILNKISKENYDLSKVPTNAVEHIHRVLTEKKALNEVLIAPVERVKQFRIEQKQIITTTSGAEPCPREYLPKKEWQQSVIKDFVKVRLAIAELKDQFKDHPKEKPNLPHIDSLAKWYALCVGKHDASSPRTNQVEGCKPLLRTMLAMPQSVVCKVLEYHIEWLEEGTTDVLTSAPWLYALLACLEIPCESETHWLLRQLARKVATIRASLESKDSPDLVPINLLICLIARYFEQYDLGDPYLTSQ